MDKTRILSEAETLAYQTGLERGRAEMREEVERLRAELSAVRMERDAAQASLSVRWALRREVEELLGFKDRDTYSEDKFREALERIKEALRK